MFTTKFNKRPIIENCQVISVADFVRTQVLGINQQRNELKQPLFSLSDEVNIKKLIDKVKNGGTTINLKQERNGQFEYSKENHVNLAYTRSNLGRGYIFWFLCNGCGRRTRYLYFPEYSEVLACRQCHRLSYKKQNETKNYRTFDKMFK